MTPHQVLDFCLEVVKVAKAANAPVAVFEYADAGWRTSLHFGPPDGQKATDALDRGMLIGVYTDIITAGELYVDVEAYGFVDKR